MPPSEMIKGDSCHRQALSHESGLWIITASSQQPRGVDEDVRTPLSPSVSLFTEHLLCAKITQRRSTNPHQDWTCNPSPRHQSPC